MSELQANQVLFTLLVVPGYYWWGNSMTVPLSVTVFYPCCCIGVIDVVFLLDPICISHMDCLGCYWFSYLYSNSPYC